MVEHPHSHDHLSELHGILWEDSVLDLLVGLVVLHRSLSLLTSQPIVALVVVVDFVCILVVLEAHPFQYLRANKIPVVPNF